MLPTSDGRVVFGVHRSLVKCNRGVSLSPIPLGYLNYKPYLYLGQLFRPSFNLTSSLIPSKNDPLQVSFVFIDCDWSADTQAFT